VLALDMSRFFDVRQHVLTVGKGGWVTASREALSTSMNYSYCRHTT